MELRQLEHFLVVADERHFTRAARRLHLVQSAVSASIRSLERDLGIDLFLRTTQRVELTDAGALLVPQARRILADVDAARALLADVGQGLRGTLTIGTMQALSAGPVDVAQVLGDFCAEHPLVEVRLRQAGSGSVELAEELRLGRIDLAILSLPERAPTGVALEPLGSEQMAFVCSPEHPLATRRTVQLGDVADEPFIDHPTGWGTRASVDQAFAAARHQRTVAFEVGDTLGMLSLVRHRLGVAILPPSLVRDSDAVRVVPLRGRAPLWEVSLATATNRPPSAAARAFVERCRAVVRGPRYDAACTGGSACADRVAQP
jgi:DNA-binding transcriptional LysR family regulator